MIKTIIKRCTVLVLCMVITFGLFGCNLSVNNGKRIVRIAIAQSETHPEYLGLVAFNLDSRKRDEDTTSRIAANP